MCAQQGISVSGATVSGHVTLQVLRTHRDTLLSVLETLVHDPLVEWVPKNAKSGAEEQENAMARDAMATIEGQHQHTNHISCVKTVYVAAPHLHSDTTHALGVVHVLRMRLAVVHCWPGGLSLPVLSLWRCQVCRATS